MRCVSDNRCTVASSLTLLAVPTIRRERRCVPLLVVSVRGKVLEIIFARQSLHRYYYASSAHVLTG